MWEREGKPEAFLEGPLGALHGVIRLIRETPIPFVAAVNGVCVGAGTNFALACDLVIATENVTFNEAFVKIGLTPDCGGSFFLPRAIGEKLAAELFMTGESVSAERAAQFTSSKLWRKANGPSWVVVRASSSVTRICVLSAQRPASWRIKALSM